jgi:DNA-binding beta-propeller fold protein YncE
VLVLLILSAYVGLLWRPKVWLIAASCFFVPFVLLYTTFFWNTPAPWESDFWHGLGGFWTGIWGSLDYWLGQHHVKRGNQPDYYYAILTPLYEFLPLLLALGGAAWLALRGDSLKRWLLFWIAGSFIGLSVAGEKMPWLEVHIALPLALAAAVALAAAADRLDLTGRRWLTAAAAGVLSAAAVLLIVEGHSGSVTRFAGWVLAAGLLGWTLASLVTGGLQGLGRAALAVFVAALLTLTVRASITASFQNDDTPVDMLVYTQTAPDIVALRDRIDSLAKESGLGYNLPIVIDPTDGFAWPWAWYLRHYHGFSYTNPANVNYTPPEGAVLLVNRANAANVPAAGYSQTPYKHRWWFDENGYRGPNYTGRTLGELLSVVTSIDQLESMGHFFLYRRDPVTTTGSVDAVAFIPDNLAAFDVSREPPLPPPEPVRQEDGRIVFGRTGGVPGELSQPAGLHVDAEGNIWVADARNNRIQKFDAQGNLLAVLGAGSAAPAAFNEPWAVTTDAAGNVYVADTWNHRIQKFTPALELITVWGEPSPQQDPSLLQLFGPRSLAIDGEGNVWVTDTGNKRLIRYSPDGVPLDSHGTSGTGAGQFQEPVGLAYDAQGRLYVADTWNGRIQRFDAGFGASVAFAAGWSSQEVIAKPYLAVLRDGRIVASDPAKGLLFLLDAAGRPAGTWRPADNAQPLGVAALPDGGFVFSDARRNEAQIVPAGLVDQLFR